MFEILNRQILAPDIKRLDIYAPAVAAKVLPGQFVSVSPEEGDESIPLSVVDWDAGRGTISLIFHEVGETTKKLGRLSMKDPVFSILGPLGVPAKIERRGRVIVIATGTGAAQIFSIARAFSKMGNKVTGILGAKTKRSLMLESQMRMCCQQILITTNDGTCEKRGVVTDALKTFIDKKEVDLVYAIGSVDMMQAVCALTKPRGIETRVHVNPIMVDCMGMCGSCRVRVGDKTVLACIEGPEFNGHLVDFEDLKIRMNAFKEPGQWRNRLLQPSPEKKESGTFKKFLSGIIKS